MGSLESVPPSKAPREISSEPHMRELESIPAAPSQTAFLRLLLPFSDDTSWKTQQRRQRRNASSLQFGARANRWWTSAGSSGNKEGGDVSLTQGWGCCSPSEIVAPGRSRATGGPLLRFRPGGCWCIPSLRPAGTPNCPGIRSSPLQWDTYTNHHWFLLKISLVE